MSAQEGTKFLAWVTSLLMWKSAGISVVALNATTESHHTSSAPDKEKKGAPSSSSSSTAGEASTADVTSLMGQDVVRVVQEWVWAAIFIYSMTAIVGSIAVWVVVVARFIFHDTDLIWNGEQTHKYKTGRDSRGRVSPRHWNHRDDLHGKRSHRWVERPRLLREEVAHFRRRNTEGVH